jgi:ankyrin repeat protein
LGFTPLHSATYYGKIEAVKVLLANGADVNANFSTTPLHCAIRAQALDIAELLLAHGADVQAIDDYRYTPLHSAAWCGNVRLVKLLVAKGANIHVKCGGYGHTPLHKAADEGSLEIVELLLTRGADVNAKDDWGCTPLNLARKRRHGQVMEFLSAHGGRDEEGETPRKKPGEEARRVYPWPALVQGPAIPTHAERSRPQSTP